jgi:hypothetical protein
LQFSCEVYCVRGHVSTVVAVARRGREKCKSPDACASGLSTSDS